MYPKHLFRFVRHFRTDRWYRTRIIVPAAMLANAAFALMYFCSWLMDMSSTWFLFLSGYYTGIMSLRIHLTRSKNRIDSAQTVEEAKIEKEFTVRKTGMYLLAVTAAIGFVSNQILTSGHNFYYPLWMLIVLSAYSITAFCFAISNIIHDHLEDMLIRSTRAVSMVSALTGMYVLTASLFVYTQFSSTEISEFLDFEGSVVFIVVMIMSVKLILLPDIKSKNHWNSNQ